MHKKWLILFLSIPSWLFYIVLAAYRVFFLIAFGMFLILVLIINIPFWMLRMIWTWIIGPILALFQFLTDINNFIWGLIFWPFTFVGWLVMLLLEILMLIPQWILWLLLVIHDVFWFIAWFALDIIIWIVQVLLYIVLFIPNLILYYWGLLMAMIFRPLDNLCIWWFEIFDTIADYLLLFIQPP